MTFEKKTRKISERSIENAALFYLQRFATSAENLKRVLMRRVRRCARAQRPDETDRTLENGAAIVSGVIDRLIQAGLLDDDKYAEGRAATLHRRGLSSEFIRRRLTLKGVSADAAERGLEALAAGTPGVDLAGAINLARRRRLGPFRPTCDRAAMRAKDLATLARAGFGYGIAVQVIDAAVAEDLIEMIGPT